MNTREALDFAIAHLRGDRNQASDNLKVGGRSAMTEEVRNRILAEYDDAVEVLTTLRWQELSEKEIANITKTIAPSTPPDWLTHNSRGIDFGSSLHVIEETERFAIVKVPGNWARLTAYGQSYIPVQYMIVAKEYHHGDITGWYRTVHYGRLSSEKRAWLSALLASCEKLNQLPDRSLQPHQPVTNHR